MYLRNFADFNEQRFSRKFSQTINWKRKNKKAIADGIIEFLKGNWLIVFKTE